MVRRASALTALLTAGCLLAACDTKYTAVIGAAVNLPPTTTFGAANITPQPLIIVNVPTFACPSIQPFTTDLQLIVDGRGGSDLFLNHVTFFPDDGAGMTGTPIDFSTADLNSRFGETQVHGGTSRSFGFHPHFGCDLFHPHGMTVRVGLVDRANNWQQLSMRVPLQ
jgi:hypothetical protein